MDETIHSGCPFDDDGFRELHEPSPNSVERGDVDHLSWVDSLMMSNHARGPFMDWSADNINDQTSSFQASHMDTGEQDVHSNSSLISQGLLLTPGYNNVINQVSYMQSTANDQVEEGEGTDDQVDNGTAMVTSPTKRDRRGRHWKDKEKQGEPAPQPWQGNKDWAEKVHYIRRSLH
jgi:hypothetical protein